MSHWEHILPPIAVRQSKEPTKKRKRHNRGFDLDGTHARPPMKFSDDDIRAIRATPRENGVIQRLADQYSTSKSMINAIRYGTARGRVI